MFYFERPHRVFCPQLDFARVLSAAKTLRLKERSFLWEKLDDMRRSLPTYRQLNFSWRWKRSCGPQDELNRRGGGGAVHSYWSFIEVLILAWLQITWCEIIFKCLFYPWSCTWINCIICYNKVLLVFTDIITQIIIIVWLQEKREKQAVTEKEFMSNTLL